MEPNRKSDRIVEEWAAVSGTARRPAHAPHGNRPRSSLPGLVGAGLMAAALVFAVAWLGNRTSSSVGADPSASPSEVAVAQSAAPSASPAESPSPVEESATPEATSSPTPAPTATPTPTAPTIGPCATDDLTARITSWEGAAGNRIAQVTITNSGSDVCTVPTTTVPQLVDGAGTVLAQGTGTPGGNESKLQPGDVLTSEVDVSNVCTTPVVAPVTIAYDLGDGRHVVSKPLKSTDSTVPPCNGPGQPASIVMKAWTR
jgi:cytoskeletal protein RodZ